MGRSRRKWWGTGGDQVGPLAEVWSHWLVVSIIAVLRMTSTHSHRISQDCHPCGGFWRVTHRKRTKQLGNKRSSRELGMALQAPTRNSSTWSGGGRRSWEFKVRMGNITRSYLTKQKEEEEHGDEEATAAAGMTDRLAYAWHGGIRILTSSSFSTQLKGRGGGEKQQ